MSTCIIISLECIGHSLRRKQDRGGKPDAAQCEIEAACQLGERTDLRVVNTAETAGLHHCGPNAPEKRDEHDSFEVPNGKGRADDNQKNRRKNEAPLEALEQRAIAVSANHSRQMVAHCAECS